MIVRRWMTVPALAFLAAGCADSPVSPAAPGSPAVERARSHTVSTGNAVHGYDAPELESTLVVGTEELCATWVDFSHFEPEDPDVYSFEFEVWEDDTWTELGEAGGNGSGPTACLEADLLEPGTYGLRVKGMALLPTGGIPPYSPQHTEWWAGEVTVGLTLRFEALIRRNASDAFASSMDFNAQSQAWPFEFTLRVWEASADGFVDVTDCLDFPWDEISTTVTWEGGDGGDLEYRDPECADPDDDPELEHVLYKVKLANPDKGTEGSGSLVFLFEGVENENDVTFTSTRPGGGPQNR